MTSAPQPTPTVGFDAVVWDLGGVLVDWDPRYLYRRLLPDEEAVEEFLTEIDFSRWNAEQDAGRSYAVGIELVTARHPQRYDLLAAYPARFAETLRGDIPGSVAILTALHAAGVRQLALTNWSAESFPHARHRFDWLRYFEAVVVSGEERLAKPDLALFRLVINRHALDPARTVYIDDNADNVAAGAALGFRALPFSTAGRLADSLRSLGLPLASAGTGG